MAVEIPEKVLNELQRLSLEIKQEQQEIAILKSELQQIQQQLDRFANIMAITYTRCRNIALRVYEATSDRVVKKILRSLLRDLGQALPKVMKRLAKKPRLIRAWISPERLKQIDRLLGSNFEAFLVNAERWAALKQKQEKDQLILKVKTKSLRELYEKIRAIKRAYSIR